MLKNKISDSKRTFPLDFNGKEDNSIKFKWGKALIVDEAKIANSFIKHFKEKIERVIEDIPMNEDRDPMEKMSKCINRQKRLNWMQKMFWKPIKRFFNMTYLYLIRVLESRLSRVRMTFIYVIYFFGLWTIYNIKNGVLTLFCDTN